VVPDDLAKHMRRVWIGLLRMSRKEYTQDEEKLSVHG
jgi:hypothetical protein